MKKIMSIVAIMLVFVMLVGCGNSGNKQVSAENREDIKITLNSEPTALHAGFATSVVASFVGTQIFDTLIIKNDATGEFEPSLAKSWNYTDDSKSLIFELRDDVSFHNGDKMTADDVVFSFETIIAAGYANVLTSFIENVEKVDETHVRINCKMPYGPALECIAQSSLGIFSKAVYENNPDGFIRNPIGTGPYKFAEWKSGASISVVSNENYFKGAPAIKNATFIIYNNSASSAALALENDELDVLTTVASTDFSRLESNENLQFITTPGSTVTFVMFSMKDGNPFNDENLRLAVAYAIDKEAVKMGTLEGEGSLANSLVPSYCYGLDPNYEGPQYNPEKAKEYLAKAGYPNGIDITVRCSSNDLYYKPMEIIQAQLKDVGINCTVEKMDSNAWFEDVFRLGNYPFQVVTFSSSIADIDYYYEMFVSNGSENFGGVCVPELDVAYSKSRAIVDLNERAAAIQEVQRVMGDKAVVIPIYQNAKAIVANKNLQGIIADPEGVYSIADWSWAK